MPNWCVTSFKVTGADKAKVLKFYVDMAKGVGELGGLDEKKRTYKDAKGEERITADDWFGNLYLAAGYTMKEIDEEGMHARGFETTVELEEVNGGYCVSINADMAWTPAIEEMRKMIYEKYGGGLSLYYLAEEPGMNIYYGNDETGAYFDCKYVIDYDTAHGRCERLYFGVGKEEEQNALDVIKGLTGQEYRSMTEVLRNATAIDKKLKKKEKTEDAYVCIYEFEEYLS